MRQTFDTAMKWVFVHEGGYSTDRNDPGNWTGGKVGKGTLKGTKYGISAKAYPKLDIKGLSQDDARALYKRDYWDKVQGDKLPAGLDSVAFDGAINSGPSQSAKWIQRSVGAPADGIIGEQTLKAVDEAARRNEEKLIGNACGQRLAFMKSLSTWKRYGKGWKRRVDEVEANAIKLARADDTYVMPTRVAGMEHKARVDDMKTTATSDGKAGIGIGVGAVGLAATELADKITPYADIPVVKYVAVGLMIAGFGATAYLAIRNIASGRAKEAAA